MTQKNLSSPLYNRECRAKHFQIGGGEPKYEEKKRFYCARRLKSDLHLGIKEKKR